MKQYILLAFAAASMTMAFAQQPAGEVKEYVLNQYVPNASGSMESDFGAAERVVYAEDGKTVYFSNLIPRTKTDRWIKGTIDGSEITISCDTPLYQYKVGSTVYDVKFGELVLEDNGGSYTVTGVRDAVFAVDGNSIFVDEPSEEKIRYMSYYYLNDDGNVRFIDYCIDTQMTLFEGGVGNKIPEGATCEQFVCHSTNDYGDHNTVTCNVYIDGNDYYFDHLLSTEALVKGTRDGNRIIIPKDEYIGSDSGYFRYFSGFYTTWEEDDEGTHVDYVLNICEDGKTLTTENGENTVPILYNYGSYWFEDYAMNVYLEKYEGDVAATPSDPYDLWWTDAYVELGGVYLFEFFLASTDVDGKFINPDNLYVTFYIDDEPFIFTTDDFLYIQQNMDKLPYGYMDSEEWDITWYGNQVHIYTIPFDLTTYGVQAEYTVDGVTSKSNYVRYNTQTKQTETIKTGIDNLNVQTVVKNPTWYDLNGRRADGQSHHGVYILDGKKIIVQ